MQPPIMSASGDDKSRLDGAAAVLPRGPRLRILCVNDVYSLENLPRLKSLVDAERRREPADCMLVTLAGDFVAPSMLSSLDKGRGMVDALNTIGVTHVCFGNHEDDIPLEELQQRVRELSGVWLNSNIMGFEPPLPAYDLVAVAAPGGRSVRVGLLGVVMHNGSEYRRPPFGGGTIEPANQTVERIADYLLSHHACSVVIPLTHQDIELDRELLQALPSHLAAALPLLIGGHEHRVYLEQVAGIHLIKAGSDAEHAAVVELAWPAQPPAAGAVDAPQVTVTLRNVKDYPEDEALRARVNARLQAVRELEAATLLLLPPGQVLSSIGTRQQQTSLSTLLSSRLRDAESAEGCLMNGGGIRGNREYRERFTYGDLKAEVPFDNELVVAVIPGRVLRDAIRSTRSKSPQGSGAYLHVDDQMQVQEPEHELVRVAGAPIDLDRGYRIALVRNLLTGMDRIEPLIDYAQAHPERLPPEGSGREVKVALVDAFSKDLFAQLGHFELLDTDRDGTLSKSELAAALSQLTSAPASPITVDLLLRAIDENADGVITRSEAERLRR